MVNPGNNRVDNPYPKLIINQKTLGEDFVDKIQPRCHLLTVYNGLPEILHGSVTSTILRTGRNVPKKVIGHGFYIGTSGSLSDLLKHYKLDKEGILSIIKEGFY